MKSSRLIWSALLAIIVLIVALHFFTRPKDRSSGEPLLVYCAAGIKAPVAELAELFEKKYGVHVQLQYGGSGTLLGNMEISRKGDVFIAADQSYVELAQDKGLIDETLPLASLQAVIAVPKGNPRGFSGLDSLLEPGVRLALANPEAASVGRLTKELLEAEGKWDAFRQQVEGNGVFKPTVPDVANDVALGAVDAGIVWDATVAQNKKLEALRLELFDTAPQDISACILKSAEHPTEALRFARWLNSTVGNESFAKHGYRAVEGDKWEWRPELVFFCGAVSRRSVDDVVKAFAEREGVTINAIYNGCGILTGQMRTIRQDDGGAGFPDFYVACDRYYLDNVSEWFQEDVDISDTEIVIAVPKGNPKGISTVADLAKEGMRVSTGQPEQCTIGALSIIMLEKMNLLEPVMNNVVMQTASSAMLVPSVVTKSVDATLAYITDTQSEGDKIDVIRIDSPYAEAIQPFSIATSSRYKHLGRRFFAALEASEDKFIEAGFRFRLTRE